MENQTNSIRTPSQVFSQIKEQALEADLILPDYYPEISKILDCAVTLSEEAVTLTADKVSISGAAKIRLLYTSAENVLRMYTSVSRYTKVIPGGIFESGDVCIVRQSLRSLNFKAVSPRKIEVRAAAAVKVNVYRILDSVCAGSVADPRLQIRKRNMNGFFMDSFSVFRLEITDNISLPVPKERIADTVRENVRIIWNEVRAGNDKVMLSGTAEINFVYVTNENEVSSEYTVSLPFTQVKDIYGVKENDICHINLYSAAVNIDPKNAGGENNEANVAVDAQIVMITGTKNEFCFVDDVYGVHGDVKISAGNSVLPEDAAVLYDQARFDGEIRTYDIELLELADKTVSDISYNVSANGSVLEINGTAVITLLAKTADGSYTCFSGSFSFSDTLSAAKNFCHCTVSVSSGAITAEYAGSGMIRCAGELLVNVLALYGEPHDMITEAVFEGSETLPENETVVLYYGTKGETLWNIAKENKTPLSALKELNTLEEDVLKEDRVLIFRN